MEAGSPDLLREFLRQEHVANRLRALRQPSVGRFLGAVLFNYAFIAATIGLSVTSGFWWLWPIAIVLIAARQHALLVLMHEGAHRSISRNRALNDLLSDLLCGAPLLVSTRSYREAHLAHHQHLNSEADPDWCRKVDHEPDRNQWLFPAEVPLWQLLVKLYGHSVAYLLKSLSDNQRSTSEAPAPQENGLTDSTLAALKYGLYALVGLLLTLSSAWTGFLIYWLAPMLLVLPLIMRIRSIAEHFALRHDHPLRQTRTVRAGWLERLVLAPHHIGLHIDHHLQASIPFYQLPKLHQLLLECPDYQANAHINDGYFLRSRQARKPLRKPLMAQDLYSTPSVVLQPAKVSEPEQTPIIGPGSTVQLARGQDSDVAQFKQEYQQEYDQAGTTNAAS